MRRGEFETALRLTSGDGFAGGDTALSSSALTLQTTLRIGILIPGRDPHSLDSGRPPSLGP